LIIEDGARLDVSGLRDVALPAQRHQLVGRLFKNELADQPVQRDGPLYRQEVQWDARNPLGIANADGFYTNTLRTAREWSTQGGNIRLITAGSLLLGDNVALDVSGGSVRYADGVVLTSALRRGSQVVAVDEADPNVQYEALLAAGARSGGQTGEVQGFDAGSITIHAQKKLHLGAMAKFRGDVVVGPRQRAARTSGDYTFNRETYAAMGRPKILSTSPHLYAELRPLGGTLRVGAFDLSVPDPTNPSTPKNISQIKLLPTTEAAAWQAGSDADAFLSQLPDSVNVDTRHWSATGLSQLALKADDINVQAGVALNLGPSGAFTANAINEVRVAGNITSPGGTVDLTSDLGDVVLASGAQVNLAGQQLDEFQPLANMPTTIVLDGGTFTAQANRSLLLQAGSTVDVSAGVWRRANGKYTKGAAGSVDLALSRGSRQAGLAMQLAGQLKGYGFKTGGSLSIEGLRALTVAALGTGTSAAALPSWDLTLDPAIFTNNGFSNITLASAGDVAVLAGALIQPKLSNWVVNPLALRSASDELSQGLITQAVVLPVGQRQAVALSLSAKGVGQFEEKPIDGLTAPGNVRIQSGALVDVGAGGSLTLQAAGTVDVAGELRARGGRITARIAATAGNTRGAEGSDTGSSKDTVGYLADSGVRLRSGAVLDVSGIDNTYRASNGQLAGDVLAGGEVALNLPEVATNDSNGEPRRGKVVAESGSIIRADGAKGAINAGNGSGTLVPVSRNAGRIRVASADGILMQGTLSAQRPDATAEGGRFEVSLSREGNSDATNAKGSEPLSPYPVADRTLQVVAGTVPSQTMADLYGTATVSAQAMQAAGFDHISLRSEGRVRLGDGVSLKAVAGQPALRTVALNAPVLEVAGTGVREVQAHAVALGDVDHTLLNGASTQTDYAASAGETALKVEAGRIAVYGSSAIQGSGNTLLAATLGANGQSGTRTDGEVVLVGRTVESSMLNGRLAFDGELTLQAGQTYATTLSDFKVEGKPGSSTLTVKLPDGGSTSRAPLSALAKLTLSAHDVAIRGVVRQPFGSITILGGTKPELGAGSLLSVSGDGLKVPVGNTFSQTSWYYDAAGQSSNGAINTAAHRPCRPKRAVICSLGNSWQVWVAIPIRWRDRVCMPCCQITPTTSPLTTPTSCAAWQRLERR
jgi:hypothetical protein